MLNPLDIILKHLIVGSMDRESSQQLQMWFSEHFFAKTCCVFVTPIVSATVDQIWREKLSDKPHFILLLR